MFVSSKQKAGVTCLKGLCILLHDQRLGLLPESLLRSRVVLLVLVQHHRVLRLLVVVIAASGLQRVQPRVRGRLCVLHVRVLGWLFLLLDFLILLAARPS